MRPHGNVGEELANCEDRGEWKTNRVRVLLALMIAGIFAIPVGLVGPTTHATGRTLRDLWIPGAVNGTADVEGKISNVEYFWQNDSGASQLMTRATLVVDRVLSGQCPAQTEIVSYGGIFGSWILEVSGIPTLINGDRIEARLGAVPAELGPAKAVFLLREGSNVIQRGPTQYEGLRLGNLGSANAQPQGGNIVPALAPTLPYTPGYGYLFGGSRFWRSDALPQTYYLNNLGCPQLGGFTTDVVNAVTSSFNTWVNDPGSAFTATYGGSTTRGSDQWDGSNVVLWANIDGAGGTLAECRKRLDLGTGRMVEADIVFDNGDQWSIGAQARKYDVQSLGTHEVGHFCGLEDMYDAQDLTQVMYGYLGTNDTSMRTLKWGDIAGIRFLYFGQVTVAGIGSYQAGADVAIGQINRAGALDMLFAWVDDPSGANYIYWKVGFNINSGSGLVSSWAGPYQRTTGIGSYTSGLGVGLYDINGNGIVDAIFAWCDNPSGQDSIKYVVAWDLTTSGTVSSWSAIKTIPSSGIGNDNEGMDISISNVAGSTRPDLIVAWVNRPSLDNDAVRWKIGKDIDTAGNIASGSWTTYTSFSTNVAPFCVQGCGVGVADFDMNGVKDILFSVMEVGTGPAGENKITYKVGWNVDANGQPTGWTGWTNAPVGWIGTSSQGLGLDCAQLDGYASEETVFFWIDNPSGANTCYYRIEWEGRVYGSH